MSHTCLRTQHPQHTHAHTRTHTPCPMCLGRRPPRHCPCRHRRCRPRGNQLPRRVGLPCDQHRHRHHGHLAVGNGPAAALDGPRSRHLVGSAVSLLSSTRLTGRLESSRLDVGAKRGVIHVSCCIDARGRTADTTRLLVALRSVPQLPGRFICGFQRVRGAHSIVAGRAIPTAVL